MYVTSQVFIRSYLAQYMLESSHYFYNVNATTISKGRFFVYYEHKDTLWNYSRNKAYAEDQNNQREKKTVLLLSVYEALSLFKFMPH